MNAFDILKYGNLTLLSTIDGLPDSAWRVSGVCGVWSVQDVIAHLASYEVTLVEALTGLSQPGPTPTLDLFINARDEFNDAQVARRKVMTFHEVLAEYEKAHQTSLALVSQIPAETLREPGKFAWYGPEYSIDDFLVYTFYGHKREHSAQIAVFRDSLK